TSVPFCDNFQPGDNATNASAPDCEAGIYIGSDIHGGGLLVASNSGQPSEPVVKSNSSIIVRSDGDSVLKVDGGIWARRFCTGDGHVYAKSTSLITADHTPTCGQTAAPMTIDCQGTQVDGKDCFPWVPRTGALGADDFAKATDPITHTIDP